MFFLIIFMVFGITYSWVGWRLIGPLPGGSAWRWVIIGVLVVHFISIFISFATLRSLGPGGWAAPLYWVAYGGMGLFSLVFTGMVATELGWFSARVSDKLTGTKLLPEDESRRVFFRQSMNLGVLGLAGMAGAFGVWRARRCARKGRSGCKNIADVSERSAGQQRMASWQICGRRASVALRRAQTLFTPRSSARR